MSVWNPNPTGKGGFRDHPEHAATPGTPEHMTTIGALGGRKSGVTRTQQADARFEARTRQALLDIRADLSDADVRRLVRLVRLAYNDGIDRGYARARYRRSLDREAVA